MTIRSSDLGRTGEVLDFLFSAPTLQAVIDLRPTAALERLHYLFDGNLKMFISNDH